MEKTVYQTLSEKWQDQVTPLQGRLAEIAERRRELADTKRDTVLKAQLGVLARELEAKIAAGDDTAAQEYRGEINRVQGDLAAIIDNRQKETADLDTEAEGLNNELKMIAKTTLDGHYETIIEAVFEKLAEWLDTVETSYDDVKKYAQDHGLSLGSNYKARLSVNGHNLFRPNSRDLQRRASEWV